MAKVARDRLTLPAALPQPRPWRLFRQLASQAHRAAEQRRLPALVGEGALRADRGPAGEAEALLSLGSSCLAGATEAGPVRGVSPSPRPEQKRGRAARTLVPALALPLSPE